ncbi:uroporphyrinogen-III synthase [Ectothiorhodosinus mongolicus]|uniref:Uroporphyrinogen-III synthase n=3 Tax=Ectothiorhodosinus mongolicus TaxID=233100 RepID=A0A1R3VWM7_9GAMM|nr:uroporphyrinogen-III synthase [Ectothiorhodosinus mongolicus]SIT69532.1 uroporphyrinogen-III synthase [Ectothiorhodosinus mongolicus]
MVTRPAHQAEPFCQMITAHGGIAHRCPAMAITAGSNPKAIDQWVEKLETVDLAIFVSPNAVEYGLREIYRRRTDLPDSMRLATVGQKSAQALVRNGLCVDICPDSGFDSEALLTEPVLQQVEGQQVLIFRGNGGRDLLGATLRNRGARVDYVEVYRRILPPVSQQQMAPLKNGEIDVIAVTSAELLNNLCALIPDDLHVFFLQQALVTGCERISEKARALGFSGSIISAENPSDEAMLNALKKWAQMREATHERRRPKTISGGA